MRKISIFSSQRTISAILENWFVQNVVLPERPVSLEWEIDNLRNQVVIYVEIEEINLDLIGKLKNNGNKIVLFQVGDEFKEKFNFSTYQNVDFILRNYYFFDIFSAPEFVRKILWVPNGYKTGIGPRSSALLRSASERKFLATFLGWIDNPKSFGRERQLFKEAADCCTSDILLAPSKRFGEGLPVGLYSAIMEYSVFCPCPAGNNPETIRLYDALELGCIPVSLKHDYLFAPKGLAGVPFPLLNNWAELPSFLARARHKISTDPDSINRLQESCINWWGDLKIRIKDSVFSQLETLGKEP